MWELGATDRRAPGHRWGGDLVQRRKAFRMSKVAAKLSAGGRDLNMHELSSHLFLAGSHEWGNRVQEPPECSLCLISGVRPLLPKSPLGAQRGAFLSVLNGTLCPGPRS